MKDITKNTIMSDRVKIIATETGIKLFWEGKEVVKGTGLSIAVNTLGIWTDSTKASWQVIEKGSGFLHLKAVFWNLPITQNWKLRFRDEQEIDLEIDMEVEEWLYVDEIRLLCPASPQYKNWINGYQEGDFPRSDNLWHELCPSEISTTLIGARFSVEEESLPSLVLETGDKDFLPLIQNPPQEFAAHIIGFRRLLPEEKRSYLPGKHPIFSGKIRLFEYDYLLDSRTEALRQDYFETRMGKQKIKVLLVNLPWAKKDRWGVRAGSRWPHIKDPSEGDYLPFPFFLAYAASLLEKHAIEARLFDAIAERISEEEFLKKISAMDFDYLVAETSIPSFYHDLALLKKIAALGIRIILCGPNAEIYRDSFLKEYPFIGFVLCAEYEFSLLELIKSLQRNKKLSKVEGLVYRDKGTIKKNPQGKPSDINLLPWPKRDTVPIHKYLDAPGEMPTPCLQIMASRGCPFQCKFCLWPQVLYNGNHYRVREIKDVVSEMEYFVKENGFRSVYFDDDTFNVGKERMLNFCQEIINRGLETTPWAIMARPDLMDEEILQNMKKAGLWAVKYGVESASQSLLDKIGKNMDLKKTEKMISFTKQLGIRVHLTFTFGLPGETKKTIEETIRYALKLDPFSVQFSITTPFPGTEYYRILEAGNFIVSKNFSAYDGHARSVIRLEDLSSEDLELAKEKAYRFWADHLRKKRGFLGDIGKFFHYAKEKGFVYALHKINSYFKYLLLGRNRFLNPGV